MGNPKTEQAIERLHERLRDYLGRKGLKFSRQRDAIADVFFNAGGHLSVEELLDRVREVDGKVSQATVYRTMNLLKECGLAQARNFFDGRTLYEIADEGGSHHDHLICLDCGKIIEFFDASIEKAQDKIAADKGFRLQSHKMELYGHAQLAEDGTCLHCGESPNEEEPAH